MKNVNLLFIFLFVTALSHAQIDFKQVVPPNPNVASLFKSVLTPVTEYAGLPNVSIPLHNLSQGNISVPFSLSYHTGGIQVGEEAGQVGLGWALNAGGAITRQVNGIDDFKPTYGYYNHTRVTPDLPTQTEEGLTFPYWRPDIMAFVKSQNASNNEFQSEICRFLVNTQEVTFNLLSEAPETLPDFDYMPDIFHFNFGGYSGSFVFDENRTPFLLQKKGLKIEMIGGVNDGFKITTENGTQYTFSYISKTYMLGLNPDNHISAWFLSSILDIYGNVIEFNYDTPGQIRPIPTFINSFVADINTGAQSYEYILDKGPITENDDVFLNTVVAKNVIGDIIQEVKLIYSSSRLDIQSKYLEKLEVYNSRNNKTSSCDFSYSYFGNENLSLNSFDISNGDFANVVGAVTNDYPHLNLRLKLDSVIKDGIEEHSFEYFGCNTLPNKTNMGQDYWGYYNGAINSGTFIPYAYDYGSNAQSTIFTQEKQANRLPSLDFAKTFSLKSITYPTKGRTEFDYELNTYDPDSNPGQFPIVTVPKSVRASKVSTADPNDDVVAEIITPKTGSVLKLTYNVTFTGWNTAYNNNQYLNSKPPPPNWQNDFYVEFRDMDNNLMRPRFHIPGDNTEWFDLTPEINQGYSQERIINYSFSEEWYFDDNATNQLNAEEFVIIAYFDSSDGLYYGQADIHAEWDEALVDENQQYSVGGGLRVASISDFTQGDQLATKRNFNYHYLEEQADLSVVEKSYGKIKTLPNFSIDKIAVRNLSVHYSDYPPDYAPIPVANATSHNSFSKDYGSYVGYDQVEVTTVGLDGPNGKTVKKFFNEVDLFRPLVPEIIDQGRPEDSFHKFPPIRLPHNGLLISETNYKNNNGTFEPISLSEFDYTINGLEAETFTIESLYQNTDRVISGIKELPVVFVFASNALNFDENYWYCENMYFHLYPHYSNLVQEAGSSQTVWDTNGNNPITTIQEFKYENPAHLQRTESKLVNSKGEEIITKTYYADDITDISSLGQPNLTSDEKTLIDRFKKDGSLHRIGEPIQSETTVNNVKTVQRTYYKDWDISPNANSYKVWPESVKTLKGDFNTTDNPMENRLNYHKYDIYGNPLEVSKEDGTKISYLWGYNSKHPVAKVEHASYDDIIGTGVDFQTISDSGTTDSAMRAELSKIRANLPEAMVTTYTYNPLVGVTSVTDPRGYSMYYEYDTQNRLKNVKNDEGHLITDYEYHYIGQDQ